MKLFNSGNKTLDESAQIDQNISNVEGEIQKKIFEMGQTFLNQNRKNNNLDEYYVKTIDLIIKLEANRKSFYANKLRMQGLMMCQNCGTIIPFGSIFCSGCGQKADEKIVKEEVFEMPNFSEEKNCNRCGAKAEESSDFCAMCGNKLN